MGRIKRWIVVIVSAFIVVKIVLPLLALILGPHIIYFTSPRPLEPEITRYEFKITLEYEQKGERKTATDTIICEYKGIEMDPTNYKKSRAWDSWLVSGEEGLIIWTGINKKGKEEVLWFVVNNSPWYLMGDPDYKGDWEKNKDILKEGDWIINKGTKGIDGSWREYDLSEDECDYMDEEDEDKLLKEYDIKLLSYTCDPPIKNTFR